MLYDRLAQDLYAEICHIPLIDPHTHIDPRCPAARSLDDILGYHYYTELAHSAGVDKAALGPGVDPIQRTRTLINHLPHFANTVQYQWLLEIARAFLGFEGLQIDASDCDWLYAEAERLMSLPNWEEIVLRKTNLEQVFLTNDFDDPLKGFDCKRYVPCLRTDDLVFELDRVSVRQRLAECTNVEPVDAQSLRAALTSLFEHFIRHGAKACAISLPPDFSPLPVSEGALTGALAGLASLKFAEDSPLLENRALGETIARGVFWLLAELCRTFRLPFDLMIGVNRRVYRGGVHQGQDLFDQRTSLIQYAELFNAFPEVVFCISVLSSRQNQELASYSWIFPNVYTFGHWWYSNIPAYIASDLRARLQAVPKTKQVAYYSDMYKLEFALPKFNMYRRILAQVLADDYVRTRIYTETEALELAQLLLRGNVQRVFSV